MSRYCWDQAPEWAMFAATDSDGFAWWYEREPTMLEHDWARSAKYAWQFMDTRSADDWRDSLESRPTAKEAAPGDVSTISPTDSSLTVAAARGDWAMVPRVPTEAMHEATFEISTYVAFDRFCKDWERVLAAAPSPPAPAVEPVAWRKVWDERSVGAWRLMPVDASLSRSKGRIEYAHAGPAAAPSEPEVSEAMVTAAMVADYRGGHVTDWFRGSSEDEAPIIRAILTAALQEKAR